jgi:hypothetical protein
MDHFDYGNPSFVSHLNPIEGIQFDGRAFALYGMKIVEFRLILYLLFCRSQF